VNPEPAGTTPESQLGRLNGLAIVSAATLVASCAIFLYEEEWPRIVTALALLSLPYAAIPSALRAGATKLGIAIAMSLSAIVLLLSPIVAFYLLGALFGMILIPPSLCVIGLLLVPVHAALLVTSIRALQAIRPSR
jgi:hypothetical protein